MNLYLDSSALVKRYVVEAGSEDVNSWICLAQPACTGLLTLPEVAAAISRAARLGWIEMSESQRAISLFHGEWEQFGRLPISEATVRRAGELACRHDLRGYDSVHLACALLYQDGLGLQVTLATYDRTLWEAASGEGLACLPGKSP
jgi:predicted nucleic acid-binding protein